MVSLSRVKTALPIPQTLLFSLFITTEVPQLSTIIQSFFRKDSNVESKLVSFVMEREREKRKPVGRFLDFFPAASSQMESET